MKRDRSQRRPHDGAAPDALDVEALEAVVTRARAGDREALELVVGAIQDRVFGLALRMLGHRSDAQDATQEILVKVITRLNSFRGESRFTTWVYSVASNHLRTLAARGLERRKLSFDQLAERQCGRLEELAPPRAEHAALTNEIRVMCLHQLLSCLDREHRLAYLFGEVLELSSAEGAHVLDIESATYRKRLSRARKRMQEFMRQRCGLVRSDNVCQCEQWVELGVAQGVVDPDAPHFTGPGVDGSPQGTSLQLDAAALEGLDELTRIATLFRRLPGFRAPEGLMDALSAVLSEPPGRRPKA